ncbi:MAG: SDR family NAD(P)-dependent oxidoreductase [bacterium]|nr:SDR family NAD(P)-dependent oxidoreductase [bacterium]
MLTPINELLNLANKTAVVTGGAAGIGRGIVNRLHEAGANVVVADVDDTAAKTTADELNAKRAGSALAIHVDVSSADDVNRMVRETVSKFSGVDIFVNNAGIYPAKPLHDMADEDFKKVLDINLHGAFLCTKYASEQMISQGRGGKIINITSIDALHPSMVGLAHYDASKHGLWGFTKNVALELASHKIWVNAIAPGGITTPGVAKMQGPAQPGVDMNKVMEAFMAKIPMRRMGEPDEIGKAVLFLASDMASYMTGSQIVVDGGALLS